MSAATDLPDASEADAREPGIRAAGRGKHQVLLVANNFPPVRGGSAVVYANLAKCAPQRLRVLAPRLSYIDGWPLIGWREHDRTAAFRVDRLPLLRTRMAVKPGATGRAVHVLSDILIRARLAWAVLWAIVAGQVRAVCVGELLASSWIIQALRLIPGVRMLVYVHGEEITTRDASDIGLRRLRRALLGADEIIVVSRFTQASVLAVVGEQARGRIRLIENGVDTTRFVPAPRDAELLARYRLEGRFVFISVCRLLEKKGVDQALRAFAQLLPLFPDTRYVVVGTGEFAPALHALATELGLDKAVWFAGNVAEHELVDHYRLGDVFVMPNRALPNGDTEGFGLVFLEANACGVPVIAGRDGGSVDAVRDEENGLVVDGHSVDAVFGAMLRLRTDPDLRQRIAQQGLQIAQAADWTGRAEAFVGACLE